MIKRIQKNPWPYAIIGYFVVFITAMGSWITFAMRNDMELVRDDYYYQQIKYQAQIDRMRRTAAVRQEVGISYSMDEGSITIALPKDHTKGITSGELHLYRPSNARLDRRIPLAVSGAGTQTIKVADFAPGLWKARLSWQAGGSEYYFDQPLVLGSK